MVIGFLFKNLQSKIEHHWTNEKPYNDGSTLAEKKKYSADEDIEEEERHGAGYIDEPRKESYLPDSNHRSRRHMVASAKNTLMLVLEFGCPHVFLTLACNPEWPEIES